MLSDPPLTKRQLGWLILLAGIAVIVGSLGVDVIGAGRFTGLGPAQKQALLGGIVFVLFGLTLLPLGHRPA
jgi:hypothetical protein